MISRIEYIENKILDKETIQRQVGEWKLKKKKIVFTNGCFDILHHGHIEYLAKSAELGDKLIIGINTDDSVRLLQKGKGRPVNKQESRALLIAALGFVDAVVLFNESTPIHLIELIKPNILVKGGDYNHNEKDILSKNYIVGSDIVYKNDGEVRTIPLKSGFSTTEIINKIKRIN
jgi:rfaE bifunctional protein nucleotidyltransferase chain/domain